MKKFILLFLSIIVLAIIIASFSITHKSIEESSSNTSNHNTIDPIARTAYKKGLIFPKYSTKTTLNGYTYELVNEKKDDPESYKYKRTVIYRYTDETNKQEWHVLDGKPGVKGIFDNSKLIYLQNDGNYDKTIRLKRLDLQTLTIEELYVKNRINGMFQYGDYIMLLCGDTIIKYDLQQRKSETIINSSSMGSYCYLESDNVFACNGKIYIAARMESRTSKSHKIYSADLDGNNLLYTGISISDFSYISSVNETNSYFVYCRETDKIDENRHIIYEEETIYLK